MSRFIKFYIKCMSMFHVFYYAAWATGLRGDLAMFKRSAITPPKVNRFGWNLDYSEYIVGGWFWQILRSRQIFCQVNNARFHRFPVGQISQNLNTTTQIGVDRNRILTIYRKGSFKKRKKIAQNFNVLLHQAVITTQWLPIARNSYRPKMIFLRDV